MRTHWVEWAEKVSGVLGYPVFKIPPEYDVVLSNVNLCSRMCVLRPAPFFVCK